MAISPIGAGTTSYVHYKGKDNAEKVNQPVKETLPLVPEQKVIVVKQTGGALAGLLSAVFPGLGHLLDGRPLAGLGWCTAVFGSAFATFLSLTMKGPIGKYAFGGGLLATLGLYVANIVNAAKGKKISEQINLKA